MLFSQFRCLFRHLFQLTLTQQILREELLLAVGMAAWVLNLETQSGSHEESERYRPLLIGLQTEIGVILPTISYPDIHGSYRFVSEVEWRF